MMIQSLVRITSQCCHAPDDVNVNIARSESVPVQLQLADKMAGQQMSSYPRYLLFTLHTLPPLHPALNTHKHCWTLDTAAIQNQVSYHM